MKPFLYLLLLLIGTGQTLFAQKVEPLEIRLMEFPIPLGEDWYQAQADAWRLQLKKDRKNETAWANYLFACNAMIREEKDSLQRQKLEKRQRTILKKMKKSIPDTRTYLQSLLYITTDENKREAIQQKITSLKRTSEQDYVSDMHYYYERNQIDKVKELAKQWYDSRLFSSDLMYYCYNELSGLKKNAVLAIDRNLGMYYYFLLQYGMELFEDVEVVCLIDLMYPNAKNDIWQRWGVDIQTLPEWNKVICSGLWYLTEKAERPVYLTQFFNNKQLLDKLKDSLYSEGLVLRYSSKPYNNLAATRKNFEQNYLLDYLRRPLIKDRSHMYNADFLRNYIISFSSLLQFYRVSGDKNQYLKLKQLLQGILDRSEKVAYSTDAKYKVLMEAVYARLKERKGQRDGVSFYSVPSLKEQYQQLIDPVEP